MLQKFLKEIMNLIVGKQGVDLADLLDGKKYVNEFLIAKKLGITINQVRNILYKLSDRGLVSFIRKKDKKKGWYTYFWKIEVLKSLEFLRDALSDKIDQLEHHIRSRETKQFYTCTRCNVEYTEENALLHDFTCSECGSIFTIKDNTKVLRDLKKELDKLKRERKLIEDEIQKEKEKINRKKDRELRKEKREKEKNLKKKKISKKSKKSLKKSLKKKAVKSKKVKRKIKKISKVKSKRIKQGKRK
ncbi:hypothetical protein DRN69_00905 [Candidatus Pacearchaeota archaeon]|nr:MAG: hypothetical protein DRN69_00905 [Candidatus Pacearchaeota archaeon]